MSWQDKALQKHKIKKQIDEVMNSPQYKMAEREREAQWTSNAIARFAFICCEFLENNHGYKANGLKKFLKYLVDCLEYTGEDEDFFLTHEKYYKEEMGLDVLAEMNMALEGKK